MFFFCRKVHITQQTRDLLEKSYDITPCNEGETDPMLKQHNIKTFLVSPVSFFFVAIACFYCFCFLKPVDVSGSPPPPPPPMPRNGSVKRLEDIEEAGSSASSTDERPSVIYDNHNQRKSTILPNGNADFDLPSQRRDSMFLRRPSGNPILTHIEKRVGGSVSARHTNGRRSGTIRERRSTPSDVKRRTAFMDNNINRYQERLRNTDINMKNAIETMPLSKYE